MLRSAVLILAVVTFGWITPLAASALLIQADFEEGNASDFQAIESPNKVDTFSHFGIPSLQGGGNYCISNNSTGGVDDANYTQFFYNKNALSNGYLRFYFLLPNNFKANGNQANTIKFALMRAIGSGDQDLYLFESGGALKFNWQHAAVGYNSGSIMSTAISKNQWHYIEINLNTSSGTVRIWFDKNSSGSPTWTNQGTGDSPYPQSTSIIQFNDNWSGGLAPQTQAWYLDGVTWSDSPIGDTYGLLGAPPPPDTTPPSVPSGVQVQ